MKLSKQNKTSTISSTNYKGDAVRDSYRSSPPKKFLSSRSAAMNNNKSSMQKNVLTSETLPEEYRNMNTWDENNNQDGQVQLHQSTSEYSQILLGSGNGAMSRIKRSNLLKVDRQNFKYHRIGTSIKYHQPSHSSGNFHHD